MRQATLFFALTVAGALSTACGHDDMDMMADHAGELEAHIGAAQSEGVDHHARIDSAATLGEVHAEEEAHEARMTDHLGAMSHEMGDMMGCMEDVSAEMRSMLDDMDRLAAERANHDIRMAEAAGLDAALAEEARHHDTMSLLMDELRDHMGSMMDDAGDYSCPHHQ